MISKFCFYLIMLQVKQRCLQVFFKKSEEITCSGEDSVFLFHFSKTKACLASLSQSATFYRNS